MATEAELRAAAERLRKLIATGHPQWVYEHPEGRGLDCRVLAEAWLAEHPTDSEQPVTEEWLRSVGLRLDYGYGYEATAVTRIINSRDGWGLYSLYNNYDCGISCGLVRVADARTRGDVRRLLTALGIGTATGGGS